MRLIILITICAFLLGPVAACSLGKSNKQSNQDTSSKVNSNQSSVGVAASPQLTANPVGSQTASSGASDELHTPERGSAERQAIMDALRGGAPLTQFQVHYIKAHSGWCWVDTTPLDRKGQTTAEGGPNLLHFENGKWKVIDLAKVPDDPSDPFGPEDASPTYVENAMKAFPSVPKDIFPKPTN